MAVTVPAEPAKLAPTVVAAAILAVPNDVKVRLMEFFLTRGKHVLVEKPIAGSIALGMVSSGSAQTPTKFKIIFAAPPAFAIESIQRVGYRLAVE